MKIEDIVVHIDEGKSRLKTSLKTSEDRIRVIFMGDYHVGAPEEICDIDKIIRERDYILKTKNAYTVLMGDYGDFAGKMRQFGPNIYRQSLSSQEQKETIIKILEPLAKEKKILGILSGNHDDWITQDCGLMVVRDISRELKVPHIANGGEITIEVKDKQGRKQSYVINVRHGKGGARSRVKMNSLLKQTEGIVADIYCMGHVHSLETKKAMHIIHGKEQKCYYLLSGHFLRWMSSYAMNYGLSPEPTGCVKAQFFSDRKDIHLSI